MVVRTIESRSVGRIWDELLSRLQAAWPEESLNWDQTPLELVTRLVNERDELKAIVTSLPHTADRVPVVAGIVVVCPKGHQHTIKPYEQTNRIYCCKGECWSSGCQSDSGSGTHYGIEQCRSVGGGNAALATGRE